MAGSQVNSYGIGDVNLTSLMASVDAERIGFCAVSLTNYDNTSEPEIAEGSKIEVNGALFKFDADEAIGGSPSDGTVYIKLIPVSTSITAEFTNTAPTWDTEKQGWYSPTPGEENYRYLPFGMIKSGASYSDKYEKISNSNVKVGGDISSDTISNFLVDFTTIALLTGSLGTTLTNISYPSGFTQSNSIILGFSFGGYAAYQGEINFCKLKAANIEVSVDSELYYTTYKILLGRMS